MSDLYLVTGGAGFIGSSLVTRLLMLGKRVRVFDNFSTGRRENLTEFGSAIELIEGDLRSLDACRAAVRDARYVLHQAALPSVPRSIADPATTHAVNVTGTLNLLNAARDADVDRVVYASSSSVYGPDPKLPRRESDRPNPISPYAVSKLAGEQYCAAFHASYGLETVSLRYFNVFGPRQRADSAYAAVVPSFIKAMTGEEPPVVWGDGSQSRDFTYIENVVGANLAALEAAAAAGRAYNVGAGRQTSVLELLHMVAEAVGSVAEPRFEPARPGDVRDSLADITAAARDLSYRVTVGLEQGLADTVRWHRGLRP